MEQVTYNKQVLAALDVPKQLSMSGEVLNNPIESARDFYRRMGVMAGEADPVFKVENQFIDTAEGRVGIRIYRPSEKTNLPVTLYFHGGWFFIGDLESHDLVLRSLSHASQSVVIAVNYRLAPEYPFPAGINDAYQTLLWLINHGAELGIDSSRIALAGDSAGGNIAAVIARKASKNNINEVKFQVLVYPVTDTSFSSNSWKQFADGPVVSKSLAEQAWSMYDGTGQNLQNPDVAPLKAEDLTGLPPALVIVGEYDPLRDEGLAYAEKLRKAGVAVQEHVYPGMLHGFFQMGGYIDAGKEAIKESGEAIKQALVNRK